MTDHFLLWEGCWQGPKLGSLTAFTLAASGWAGLSWAGSDLCISYELQRPVL